MVLRHLLLLLLEFKFIVQEVLSICQVLDRPLVFLLLILLPLIRILVHLRSSSGHYLFFLLWTQALEVVRNESVRSELALSCLRVLSHDIAHVCAEDFTLVLLFLVVPPFFLPEALLLS